MQRRVVAVIAALLVVLASCSPATNPAGAPTERSSPTPEFLSQSEAEASQTPEPPEALTYTATANTPATATVAPTATSTQIALVRFAVIGDYGLDGPALADIARLIDSWQVDFIITTGDNNYPDGGRESIDANIGKYFQQYISPYTGDYGPGADRNRFFPTLGNHDWNSPGAAPYLEYFSLPGNERYYDFTWEFVHFFALDSDSREPDGVGLSSVQAAWLQQGLASSTAPWKIVYMHQPPYSSGMEGSVDWALWPYREWGASAVLGGHDHDYERLLVDELPYFVNGLGGGAIYPFNDPIPGSLVRYNEDYGAMLVEASRQQITFQFITRTGQVVDTYAISSFP